MDLNSRLFEVLACLEGSSPRVTNVPIKNRHANSLVPLLFV